MGEEYRKHPTVQLTTRFATFDVDEELAELVVMLHAEGIETQFSCQGDDPPHGPTWWRKAQVWWRCRGLGEASREKHRRLDRAMAPLEKVPGADDTIHGYLLFPGSQAREFYRLALEATADSGEAELELLHRRLQHSLHQETAWRCLPRGIGVGSLWETVSGRWYAEVLPGYPEVFEARSCVRFPYRDLAPLTAAVRQLLVSRGATST